MNFAAHLLEFVDEFAILSFEFASCTICFIFLKIKHYCYQFVTICDDLL